MLQHRLAFRPVVNAHGEQIYNCLETKINFALHLAAQNAFASPFGSSTFTLMRISCVHAMQPIVKFSLATAAAAALSQELCRILFPFFLFLLAAAENIH